MHLNDLRKKPIVSMADGVKIGEIDDLVLDPARWNVAELYVVGQPGRGLVPFSGLKGIGPDAVTIEGANAVAYNVKSAGLCFEALQELHVVDGTGTVRGHVKDLEFEADGSIRSLHVVQGGVFGIGAHHLNVSPADIRGLGDKILTIDVPVSE